VRTHPLSSRSPRGQASPATERSSPARAVSRRQWLGIAFGGAIAALAGERWWRAMNPGVVADGATPMTMYASPSCVCCHRWVAHLEHAGFHVTVDALSDVTPIKRKLGIPERLWSCHTGTVGGLAIEGHVPADLIQKALTERPTVVGLAVPGMPGAAPGMDTSKAPYEVIAFASNGTSDVYAVR
jgi:hypothetical protein